MTTSFYSKEELKDIGFKSIGSNVLISKKSSIYSPEVISIGNNVRIDDFCILSGGKEIILHDFIHIGAYSALFGGGGIEMEDFAGTSMNCTILSASDDFSGLAMCSPLVPVNYKPTFTCAPVLLKRHSGLGMYCSIVPGITMEEGSCVVGHSMLTHNTDPWFLYFGIPARKLKERQKEILALEKDFLSGLNRNK